MAALVEKQDAAEDLHKTRAEDLPAHSPQARKLHLGACCKDEHYPCVPGDGQDFGRLDGHAQAGWSDDGSGLARQEIGFRCGLD